MKYLSCFMLLFLFGCASDGGLEKQSKAQAKPNVLFIAIDDLNDWIGCLGGHPQAKTPNIDRLAGQGTLFSRAYCPAPACLPSRAASLTGVAPYSSGCYENRPNQYWQDILLPKAQTLPGYLRENGYYTAGAGKIFHHYQNHPESWDDYWPSKNLQFPPWCQPAKKDKPDFAKKARPKNWYQDFNWGPVDREVEETGDWMSMKFVSQQLQKKHDKPFFLNCGIYHPHVPWFAPRKYFDMFPLDQIQLPAKKMDDYDDIKKGARRSGACSYYTTLDSNKYHKQAVQGYLASIAYMDDLVGRLLKNLEESDYADNTIVVLWSDHGWHFGEKLTYRKFTLWEEACRVPMIIRLPKNMRNQAAHGVTCSRTVNLMDIYPTLMVLCEMKGPRQQLDGHSLVPLLQNPTATWEHASITTDGFKNHSVRTERWRFTQYKNGTEELYDHDTDPNEWNNLAYLPAYAKILVDLRKKLPKKNHAFVKTKVFDAGKHATKYYKEFNQKKLIKRIKKEQ